MANRVLADLLGTLKSSFRIARATVSASALTAARSFTLPDVAGEVALQDQYVKLKIITAVSGDNTPDPGGPAWAWSSVSGTPIFWDEVNSRWRETRAIHVGPTPPPNPAVDDIWIDTSGV